MAAIIDIRTGASLAEPARHFYAEPAPRPSLRVIEGGRSVSGRQRQQVFVLRRMLAVVIVLIVAFVGIRLASAVVGSFTASSTSGVAAATIDASQPYIVRSGDTLWDVARAVAPQSDPRDVVDQIVQLNSDGGEVMNADSPLRVGQHLVLPTSLD